MSAKTPDDLEFEELEKALRKSRMEYESKLTELQKRTPSPTIEEIESLNRERKHRETPLRERLWELARHGVFSPQF